MMKNRPKPVVTRFAPSPTGMLHLGHLYSACFARTFADHHHGEMRLRIDDIDFTRCRPEYVDLIFDDLSFMGIAHEGEVLKQSERNARYLDALQFLKDRDYVYPCTLSRRELNALLSAPHGADQIIRNTDKLTQSRPSTTHETAWRLRMDHISFPSLTYVEVGVDGRAETVEIDLSKLDDVVIARRDIGTSYHLSVVLDDHDSGVTVVTRGDDLAPATAIHRLLQCLLELKEIEWAHHALLLDNQGRRFAKRDESESIQQYRQKGYSREDILELMKR